MKNQGKIVELYRKGKTIGQIATLLNLSTEAVTAVVSNYEHHKRKR